MGSRKIAYLCLRVPYQPARHILMNTDRNARSRRLSRQKDQPEPGLRFRYFPDGINGKNLKSGGNNRRAARGAFSRFEDPGNRIRARLRPQSAVHTPKNNNRYSFLPPLPVSFLPARRPSASAPCRTRRIAVKHSRTFSAASRDTK